MVNSRFIPLVWILSVLGLPILVYVIIMAANLTGFHIGSNCTSYDVNVGLFLSMLVGIPFATAVTVLSASPMLCNKPACQAWALMTGAGLVVLAIYIVSQSGVCH